MNEILKKIKKRAFDELKTIEIHGEVFHVAKKNTIEMTEISSIVKAKLKGAIDKTLKEEKASKEEIEEVRSLFPGVNDFSNIIGKKTISNKFDIRFIAQYINSMLIYQAVYSLRKDGKRVYANDQEMEEWVEFIKTEPDVYNSVILIQGGYSKSEGNA